MAKTFEQLNHKRLCFACKQPFEPFKPFYMYCTACYKPKCKDDVRDHQNVWECWEDYDILYFGDIM
jgi:hypothetical protein